MLHTPAAGRSQGLTRWVLRPCEGCQEEASSQPTAVALLLLQILRTLKGYDSYNTLLLPPRLPGEKLPPELYEYFKEMKRSKEEQMKAKYLETLVQENGELSAKNPASGPVLAPQRHASYKASQACARRLTDFVSNPPRMGRSSLLHGSGDGGTFSSL